MLAHNGLFPDDKSMSTGNSLPSFQDPEGQMERFGFEDRFSPSRLPGLGWEAGNMFTNTSFMPNCDMDDGIFSDTVWGMGYDGRLELRQEAPVLSEVFYSNAMRRLQAVEQLTLPPLYSTIPNTAAFSRFEHIWGSVLFVKKMADKSGLSPEDTVNYQLRTLVSDMAHTTGSHIGDWLFQGVGESEDQHDSELKTFLDVVGITDILKEHDIDPVAVVFPDKADWVEAPAPDLCVDRVDYALREMNRWNDIIYNSNFGVRDFVITPDNKLAMTNQQRARLFAEGYLLLSQEHWSEPTHHFLEELLMLRTKLFYAEHGAPDTWVFDPRGSAGLVQLIDIHPRDLMYVTDPTQLQALARPSLGGNTLDAIMRTIAQYRRQYVWPGRSSRIASYLQQFSTDDNYDQVLAAGNFKPLNSDEFKTYLNEFPTYMPIGFTIMDKADADVTYSHEHIDFDQPPFKVRQIDPLVQTATGYERLSQLDPSFSDRLAQHKAELTQPKVARLTVPDTKTRNMLRAVIDNVEAGWIERIASSRRMSREELKALVDVSGYDIHGQYPFLSFLSY